MGRRAKATTNTILGLFMLVGTLGCPDKKNEAAWADVLLVRGEVTANAQAVTEGQRLTDVATTLRVAPDASVVLGLHNHHVVRLEDDVTLALGDLIAFSLPPLPEAQRASAHRAVLDGAATPVTDEDRERVAGWHARVTASRNAPTETFVEDKAEQAEQAAPPAMAAETARDEDSAKESAPKGDADSARAAKKSKKRRGKNKAAKDEKPEADSVAATPTARKVMGREGAAAPKVTAAPAPEDLDLPLQQRAAEGLGSGPGGVGTKDVKDAKEAKKPAPPTDPSRTEKTMDQVLAGTALNVCLRDQLTTLGISAENVLVQMVVKDGKVARVKLLRGVTTPACAIASLLGRAASPDGKITRKVVLNSKKASP